MINRRSFLQIGSASIASLPVAGGALSAAAELNVSRLPFYRVVYDQSIPESVEFARAAESMGAVTHAVSGDVSSLWFEHLQPLVSAAPGFTPESVSSQSVRPC